RGQRPGRVVHQHEIALAERGEPGTYRFLAAFASGLHDHRFPRLQRGHLAFQFSRRLGGPTTTIRSISSSARNNSSTRARVVLPLRRTSALLPRPRREPDPAAATIAPTESDL